MLSFSRQNLDEMKDIAKKVQYKKIDFELSIPTIFATYFGKTFFCLLFNLHKKKDDEYFEKLI